MGPGDTFYSSDELSYLVLFRDLSIAEVQLKCAVIVEEVCHKLFGDQEEEISVRSLVGVSDVVDLDDANARFRLNGALEQDGRETLFSSEPRPPRPAAETLRVEMVIPRQPLHSVNLDKPSFVYRPLWDTERKAVLTYLCQIMPDSLRMDASLSVPFSAESKDGQVLLDELCLRECLRRAKNLRDAGLRVLFAAPLHFSTLCRPRLWSRYLSSCKSNSSELFKDMAFLAYGFESGVPHVRLAQELPKLTQLTPHVFCLADQGEGAGMRFRNTGAHAVGITLEPGTPEKAWIEKSAALARDARLGGLEMFILGAKARSAAVNAIGCGARYLEGAAVRLPVANPKNGYFKDISDLFHLANG
jgi:hypothetical protein